MRWIKPLHQDYFWEFSTESSNFHIFWNLNVIYSHVLLSANKYICKWMKEKKRMFLWDGAGHKRAIMLLFCCCIFPLYLSMLRIIHIVKWKDTAITNHLKKCCWFFEKRKAAFGLNSDSALWISVSRKHINSVFLFFIYFYSKKRKTTLHERTDR